MWGCLIVRLFIYSLEFYYDLLVLDLKWWLKILNVCIYIVFKFLIICEFCFCRMYVLRL